MLHRNQAVLSDPARLAAAERATRLLATTGLSLDSVAHMAASLLDTPLAAVSIVGRTGEQRVGGHGPLPAAGSVGEYVICGDGSTVVADMSRSMPGHPLAKAGVTAFAGVPIHDLSGRPFGALIVLDMRPREWAEDQILALTEVSCLLRASIHWDDQVPADRDETGMGILDSAALLDSVQEAFLAVDDDGVVRGFNRSAEEMLGFASAEICGRRLDDTLRPDYGSEPIGTALGRLFAAGPVRPVVRELSMRHRAGHRVAMRAALSVVRGTAGPLACVFLTDLSAQAAAEEAAERHASFLAALLDSLSVGVIACDDSGRVSVVNRAMRQIQNRPETGPVPDDVPDVVGQYLFDDEMRPLSWEQTPVMRALNGEYISDLDVKARCADQRVRTFAATAQPITSRDGRRLGAVAVAHEVTALRRAERFGSCRREVEYALRSVETIAEAAPAVLKAVTATLGWPCAELFLIDEATGELRAVGHHSDAGEAPDQLFGHVPVRGLGVTGRVWQTGEPLWVPDISEFFNLTTAYEQGRVELCARYGIRTILAVPVRDGGTLLGVLTCYAGSPEVHEELLTVLLDGVAAQIGVYVALRRAEELARQLRRAQDDFLALAGHELRTPLTSITANVTMLVEEAEALDDEQRQMLDTVARNTATLRHISDSLLDLAGLESGHHLLNLDRIDLVALVAEAVTVFRLSAADAGVQLRADLPAHLAVTGDARRLRQVVDDLLSNAVKYSLAGGEVEVALRTGDRDVELSVTDTGIGAPAEEYPRFFDRFYRASNVRHHGIPGSGLGLSLARAIVRLHSGTITLRPHQPAGTTVRVSLPLHAPAA
ncbi:ATP-binding protein [Actinoplanes sp. NBC_00393]|uniref:PAS domain-containing sensor histidine kinase n=1 Tax=Actinoplanes sp. NBC_00393 TaxID=2975953 RepID=UPI002E24E0D8